jgi:hypothetical protein
MKKNKDFKSRRSVPVKKFIKKWSQKAIVILIDEYWTSKKCSACGNKVKQGKKHMEIVYENQIRTKKITDRSIQYCQNKNSESKIHLFFKNYFIFSSKHKKLAKNHVQLAAIIIQL